MQLTSNHYEASIGFRKRESQRDKEAKRFNKLKKERFRNAAFRQMEDFDNELERKEKEAQEAQNAGRRTSGTGRKASGRGLSPGSSPGNSPRRGSTFQRGQQKSASASDEPVSKFPKPTPEQEKEYYKLGQFVRRPCSPLTFMNYGDASVKPLSLSAFKRDHKPVYSKNRYTSNYPNGSGYPYSILEPIYMQPRLEPIYADTFQTYEHQPLVKHRSAMCLQRDYARKMRTLTNKVGTTRGWDIQAGYRALCRNMESQELGIEEQRCYDGSHGFTFATEMNGVAARHRDWLDNDQVEEVDNTAVTKWLNTPEEEWTAIEKKTYDIMMLFLNYLHARKFNVRKFFQFRQTAADRDLSEMGMALTYDRFLRNLEFYGIVNPGCSRNQSILSMSMPSLGAAAQFSGVDLAKIAPPMKVMKFILIFFFFQHFKKKNV